MYCSRCGTNNREGSKFCNNCGTPLTPPVDGTCPACGTVNPLNTAFCNNCGARLVPAGATRPEPKSTAPPVKGLSLPTKSKPATPEPPAPNEDAARAEEEATGTPVTGSAQEPSPPFAADVPDWLAQLRAVPAADEQASAPPVSQDIPDWIKQLQSVQPEEAAPAPIPSAEPPITSPVQPKESSGLPAWLAPSDESSSWLPEQEPTAPSARLLDESPTPSEETPSAPPAPAAEEFWRPLPPEMEQAGSAPGAESTLPFPTEERTAKEVQADTRVTEEGLPDWLQGLQPQAPAEAKAAAPAPPSQSGLPDWLVTETTGELQPNLEGMPEWLRMAMPAEKPAEAPLEESLAEPSVEPVYPLPDTSAARQRARVPLPAAAGTQEAEPIGAGNPLAGLRGILPLAIAVAEPHMLAEKSAPAATAEKDDGARLFEAILAEAPAEAEPPAPSPAARGNRTRWLIYLLLALAAVVPFFFPSGVAGALLRISKTPAADVYDLIQALPANSTVLVAFDYEPSVQGEMDLLGNAVVRHLLQRRIKIIALSTFETGPQIAKRVLDSAATSSKSNSYTYGSDYLNIGFIPGHAAGLASLAVVGLPANTDYDQHRDIKQYPIAQNIKSTKDIALIIELAGTEQALQDWMEQVQPRIPTRIIGAVSAAVEPKALVFKRPGQLAGLFSGLMGAAQYEILSNQPGQALVSVNAQSAAQMVLILIVVLGNVVHWVSRTGGHVRTEVRAEKAK